MRPSTAPDAVRDLVIAATDLVRASSDGIEKFRGIALYDTRKDDVFKGLEPFSASAAAINQIPGVQERFGDLQDQRIALQFIYEFLNRVSEPKFDADVFQGLWDDFAAELQEPDWIFRSIANVTYLSAEGGPFVVGDGVSIRGRDFDELKGLGFSEGELEDLTEDWFGMGSSSYVMLVEDRVAKSPENFILGNLGTDVTKSRRALMALRLLAAGDIGIGRIWAKRPTRFNVGLGGKLMLGYSIPTFGSTYQLTDSIASSAREMYETLERLDEQQGYGGAPGDLDLALRSFTATYERPLTHADSRVLDSITAVEAVLGSGIEITFKLSFRVAGILGRTDADRVEIFETMKAYYDLRSKLVHGASLRAKHQALVRDLEPLRNLVRELLRGFVHLAANADARYGKQFFQNDLDSALQDDAERRALRDALGLS